MRILIFICSVCIQFSLLGQDFVAQLYFEDSLGARDTLTFGRLADATIFSLNEEIGEVDIKNDTLDNFDVRFYRIQGSSPNLDFELFWLCDYVSGSESRSLFDTYSETKAMFNRAEECEEFSFRFREQFFIPVSANFPVTVSWDASLFQDSCSLNANISEVPFFVQAESYIFCPKRINHSFISLRDSNSVILTEPNFLSYNRVREDTTLVASYYLTLPNAFNGNIMINTSEILESNVKIFPNPVQDKLYLETTDQNWNYTIQNLQGQQMMNGVYQDGVDVAQLPSGIYFLQLQREEDYFKAIKFVKK